MTEEQSTARPCCIWLEDQGGLLVRAEGIPPEVPSELREALEGCSECQAALAGAALLRAQLDAWRAPEPADDLIERSMAALVLKAALVPNAALGSAAEAPSGERAGLLVGFPPAEPGPAALPSPAKARRRTTVIELLVTPPLAGPVAAIPPSNGSLALRFVLQAAAAVVLFGVSSLFVAIYYPAVSHALQERDQVECQVRLLRLHAAATRYRTEHPGGVALVGFDLRRELIRGGYADELDFVCPSERGQTLGIRSYVGELPADVASVSSQSALNDRPLFWDRFGNHPRGFNLVRLDGRVAGISEDGLMRWRFRSAREGEK